MPSHQWGYNIKELTAEWVGNIHSWWSASPRVPESSLCFIVGPFTLGYSIVDCGEKSYIATTTE